MKMNILAYSVAIACQQIGREWRAKQQQLTKEAAA